MFEEKKPEVLRKGPIEKLPEEVLDRLSHNIFREI
jgi:hypothetical protein